MKHIDNEMSVRVIHSIYNDLYELTSRKARLTSRLKSVEQDLKERWAELLPTLDKELVKNEEQRQATSMRMLPKHWRIIAKIKHRIQLCDDELALCDIEKQYVSAVTEWCKIKAG